MKISKKNVLWIAIALALLFLVAFVPGETEAMTRTAWKYLGIFVALLVLLLSRAIPDWAAGLGSLCMMVLFNIGTIPQVFAPFGDSTIWLLIGIYTLSIGLNNSGLIKRVAFIILDKFPLTYKGQVLALMASGTVMSPLIPSNVTKASILLPVSTQVTESVGIEPRSKGAIGLWTAALIPSFFLCLAFLTGSGFVPFMISFISDTEFSWGSWVMGTWPWFVVGLVMTYLFCTVICKPEGVQQELPPDFIKAKLKELGPMTDKEKFTAVTMLIALVLWLTESIHGIDVGLVILLLVVVMTSYGLITGNEFAAKVPWGMVVFVGSLLSIATFMSSTGVSAWMAKLIGPYMMPLLSNVWIFVPALCIIVFLLRSVVLSFAVCLALFVAIFSPFLADANISMFILVWVVFCSSMTFYMPYQNPYILSLISLSGGKYITFAEARKVSYLYMAICVVGMTLSIPVWKMMGLC